MTRKRILMTAVAVAASIGVLGACTPEEVQQWQAWRAQDQAAADAFAQDLATQPEPEPAAAPAASTEDTVWDKLAYCESGGNWAINLGSGYYGGLQMLGATWRNYGGTEFAATADQASREQQIVVAERILDDVGWGAWPACSRKLGLR
jgi:ferric-dicitrate binding protein FerR (iron transport regulator)